MLLLKVHLPFWVVGTQVQVEHQLDVGARAGERDLRVALATPVLEADLALLLGTVPVARVPDLWTREEGVTWLVGATGDSVSNKCASSSEGDSLLPQTNAA